MSAAAADARPRVELGIARVGEGDAEVLRRRSERSLSSRSRCAASCRRRRNGHRGSASRSPRPACRGHAERAVGVRRPAGLPGLLGFHHREGRDDRHRVRRRGRVGRRGVEPSSARLESGFRSAAPSANAMRSREMRRRLRSMRIPGARVRPLTERPAVLGQALFEQGQRRPSVPLLGGLSTGLHTELDPRSGQ